MTWAIIPSPPLAVQVLNAGKNKLTRMDEVASLTSLGALILNGNAMDRGSQLLLFHLLLVRFFNFLI
jgi:hypothetical protein